jgi:Domain of unknown function (DUF5979)
MNTTLMPRSFRSLAMITAMLIVAVLAMTAVRVLADSGTVDVEVTSNTKSKTDFTKDGAEVTYIGDQDASLGSAGTGVFNTFVQVQAKGTERAYNSDATGSAVEFDRGSSSQWNHALKVSEVPVVSIGSTQYWELFVDINESNGEKQISLTDVEVWFTTKADLTGYPFGTPPNTATNKYDFSGNIKINDVNQGSGRGDLRYRIPLSLISGGIPTGCNYGNTACTTYFVLYTKWGASSGDYKSDGGFEEWKVKTYPTLKIIKNSIGGDGTFTFTVAPTTLTPSLTTVNGTTSQTFVMDPGSYTLAETVPSGWTLNSISCSVNGGTPTTNGQFTLTNGNSDPDDAVCTVTNTKQTGKIELRKVWVGTAGSTTLQIGTSAGGTQVDTQAANGANATTGENVVNPGTYYVSETTPTGTGGTYTSAVACFKDLNNNGTQDQGEVAVTLGANNSVAVVANDDIVCTFTNTFVPNPTVTLVKRNSITNTTAGGSVAINSTFNWLVDITVANGPATATVSDTIPTGLAIGAVTDNAASITCGVAAQVVTCNLAATPVGTYLVTIPITAPDGVPPTECGAYNNTASVTAGHGNGNQSNVNTMTVTGCATPNISLTKTNNTQNNTVAAGGTFNWVVGVTVTGGPVSGTVGDTLPTGMTTPTNTALTDSEVGSALACAAASNVVTCTLTNLANGSYTVTVPVTAPAPTPDTNCKLYTNTATVTAGPGQGNSANNGVTVTGCTTFGSLVISKSFNPGNSGFTGAFTINYDCSDGTTHDGSVQLTAGQSSSPITGIPTGTICTITEPTLPTAPAGWTFGTPVITPTNGVVTIGNNTTVTVTVTNSITQNPTFGSLVISKSFNAGNSGFTGTFAIVYNCAGPGFDGTVNLAAGTSSTPITGIPTGTICTITEPTLPTAPSGWTFGTPVITPTNGVVTIGNNTTVTVTVTNSITQNPPTTGTLTIIKMVDTTDADVIFDDEAGTFTFDLTSGALTNGQVSGGGSSSFTVPAGSYTLTEDAQSGWTNLGGEPSADGDFCWDEPEAPDTTFSVTITAGQTTYVCWYNQQQSNTGRLLIQKRVDDLDTDSLYDDVGGTFTFLNGSTPFSPTVSGGTGGPEFGYTVLGTLAAGDYTITEQAQSGWTNRGGRTFHGNGNCSTNISETTLVTSLSVTIVAGQDTYLCWYNQQIDTRVPSVTLAKRNDVNNSVTRGGSFNWLVDITVSNGPVVNPTIVTDTIPAGFVVGTVTENSAGLSCSTSGNVVTCTLSGGTEGALANGTHTVTIPVTTPSATCATYTNNVSVTQGTSSGTSASNGITTTGCGGGGGGGSSSTPTPTVQVLGSNAQIVKVRASADPARVGERVNFTVTLSITGDTTVTGVTLTDTFENAYLRYVSSAPAGCTVTPNVPDAARSQISCPIGDVTPGTAGSPGTRSFAYSFAFDALAPTPTRTVNTVLARADLDGTGPGAPANIGPATADVQIIDLPVALPKAGDGTIGMPASALEWSLLALVALAVGAAFAAASGPLNRRTQ